jgi:hypothetical protein
MKKTALSIGLCGVILILIGCAENYSGYANATSTPVYFAPDTVERYSAPPNQQPKDADQIQALRYKLFDVPMDNSNDWYY